MTAAEYVLSFVVHLLLALFWFWMGWRSGRKALLKATVDYVLKQPVPLRNYEERMLDYATLMDKRPPGPRIIL
jgi:hypothetical protein